MNDHLRLVLLCSGFLLLFSPPLQGQDQVDRDHRHSHTTFQQIDTDYRAGRLSVQQKVLYKLYAVNNPRKLPSQYRQQDSLPIKCGTPAIMEYHNNRDHLSAAANREVQSMMQVNMQATETYTSPEGWFDIKYETTGQHAVPTEDTTGESGIPDYVEEVAAAADSSYRHEVLTLGYADPLANTDTYTIEIRNLSFYGQTVVRNNTTAIQVENDFEGFPENDDPEGNQVGSLKVTIAHELKHAIQYVVNNWRGETDLWAEMDATLMEEVVYDNVNDYYNYLENNDSIFISPQESLYPGSYYQVSWALYFEERYGPNFWPAVWDYIEANPETRMIKAIRSELDNTTFNNSFIESHLWHYASGNRRATANYGFEENEHYPEPTINHQLNGADSLSNYISIPGLAANYIEFQPISPREGVVRLDVNSSNDSTGIGFFASFHDGSYETRLINGISQSGTVETNWQWNDINRVGIIVSNSSEIDSSDYKMKVYPDIPEQMVLRQNYPNPFNPRTSIEFSLPNRTEVQLKIYDIAGRLVQTLRDENLPAGFYEETFDGSNLASGVYFYQLITNNETIVKKMTLIK